MKTIRDVFAKPIDRTIEEAIKVEQADEKAVLVELDEYVPTEYLQDQYVRILDAIASGPASPREGIGVWVSGFFGSGKSIFAKILGYTVAARKVGGKTASDIFKLKVNNPRISALLDSINARIPFHAVIFDVSMDRGVRLANERLTEIIYKALLRELLPSWPDTKKAWAELEEGKYDWAHQAMDLWPDRVREKCGTDGSYAIAHGLEQAGSA